MPKTQFMNVQIKKSASGAIACFVLMLQLLIGPLHILEVDHAGTGEMGHNVQSFSEHSTGEHSGCSDTDEDRESHPAADHSDQLILPSHLESSVDCALAPLLNSVSLLVVNAKPIGLVLDRESGPRAPPPRKTAAPRAPPISV